MVVGGVRWEGRKSTKVEGLCIQQYPIYQSLHCISIPLCGQRDSFLEPLCHCLADSVHGEPAPPWGYVQPLESSLLLEPIQLGMSQLPADT